MGHYPNLEIVLDRPELLVRGSLDEASAVVLSGRVVVHLREAIRVRSLRLTFAGRVDTFLNQELVPVTVARDEHREFLSHAWQFLAPQKPPVLWSPADTTVFPFELVVRGDNPETVSTALGKVRYQLQATLERTAFHANLTAAVDVPLKRGPQVGAPWALALMESIESMGTWDDQLNYRVSVPSRSLKDGELFYARFLVEPRAKGLKLVSVGVLIKEYTRYYSGSGAPLHRFARVVARNENYITPTGSCTMQPRQAEACLDLADSTSVQIPLVVPDAYLGVQYDVLSDLIEVRHRLKFLIKVRDRNRLVHSIFVAVPVSIMPVKARDDETLLPRYEAAVLGPGTVIMRSSTLPPPYDAPPMSPVEPGRDVRGFPEPQRRAQSQFYLASPDQSPSLRAAAPLEDGAPGASVTPERPMHAMLLPPPMADADVLTNGEIDVAGSDMRPPELHGRPAGGRITGKVRSVFHSRTPSSSSVRTAGHHHHQQLQCYDVGAAAAAAAPALRSATPPLSPVIREPPPAHARPPRPASMAPSFPALG